MRLASKGSALRSIMPARRGSFITFLFTLSRCLRDLYTIHENQTTSPALSLTLRGNEVRLPHFTSSAMHSRYWSAPCSRQTLPALSAMRRYGAVFCLGTGTTKPSTRLAMKNLLGGDLSERV